MTIVKGFVALLVLVSLIFVSGCTMNTQSGANKIINLQNWKLQIPVLVKGSKFPEEISQPTLNHYSSKYMHVSESGKGIVFRAYADDVIIPGSDFARSELREMTDDGRNKAAWSSNSGTHTMVLKEAVTMLPKNHPSIVAGQVHATSSYIMLIRLDGNHMYVKADNKNIGDLDTDYKIGTTFTVTIKVSDGQFRVYYNGTLKITYQMSCDTCYFKAGAYLQSNPSYGDKGDSYGEVTIYGLNLTRS